MTEKLLDNDVKILRRQIDEGKPYGEVINFMVNQLGLTHQEAQDVYERLAGEDQPISTITRESAELKSFITGFLSDPAHDNQSSRSMTAEVFRIALASLEAEAVAWIVHARTGDQLTKDGGYVANAEGILGLHSTPLYAAPPAPVSIPECFVRFHEVIKKRHHGRMPEEVQATFDECAAMLQVAGPVSNRDELPLGYLQGHKDGLEWAAQQAEANHPQTGDWLYDDPIALAAAIRKGPDMPELKSASADEDDNFYSWFGRFWSENYQQNNYTTSAKQMLGTMAEFAFRAGRESATQAGNSPVIPGGWVACSERMPEDEQEVLTINKMGYRFVSFFDEHSGLFFDRIDVAASCCIEHILVTHWMPLPAAPQQEAK